jgi:hypothetical protein
VKLFCFVFTSFCRHCIDDALELSCLKLIFHSYHARNSKVYVMSNLPDNCGRPQGGRGFTVVDSCGQGGGGLKKSKILWMS